MCSAHETFHDWSTHQVPAVCETTSVACCFIQPLLERFSRFSIHVLVPKTLLRTFSTRTYSSGMGTWYKVTVLLLVRSSSTRVQDQGTSSTRVRPYPGTKFSTDEPLERYSCSTAARPHHVLISSEYQLKNPTHSAPRARNAVFTDFIHMYSALRSTSQAHHSGGHWNFDTLVY
jgi:hypothetical protein